MRSLMAGASPYLPRSHKCSARAAFPRHSILAGGLTARTRAGKRRGISILKNAQTDLTVSKGVPISFGARQHRSRWFLIWCAKALL
jgi:hypothetical protein